MTGTVRSAMQIPLFRGTANFLAAWCARNIARAWRQDREYRIEMLDYRWFATNHHAIAAVQSPNTSAGSHVDIMELFCGKFFGAPDIVDIIGIAAVDEDIARLQQRC